MANGQGQGGGQGGRGGGTGDIFSTTTTTTTETLDNRADAMEENKKQTEAAAEANDKFASSSEKMDRQINASVEHLNKFDRGLKRTQKETDSLGMKLAKAAVNFTSLQGAMSGVVRMFKPLTILQKRYKLRLDELESSQQAFNASLFQSTATMNQAAARHDKYLNTMKNAQMDAIDLANKYNMSSDATKKISKELTATFANQIMSYKDQRGVLKSLQEETLIFSRVMGVDTATSVKFMREQLEHSGRTLDEVRRETWAVVKAADEYTRWLEKMGDEAKRVANINRTDLIDAISKTTKLFNQGKFEVEGYTAIVQAYIKEAKNAGRTSQEIKNDMANIGRVLDKVMSTDLSSALWMPDALQDAISIAERTGDKILKKRLEYAEETRRKQQQSFTHPQHLRRLQSALRGTTAGTMAFIQAVQKLPGDVGREMLLASGAGDQGMVDILHKVMKPQGEATKKMKKSLDKRGKDAGKDAAEQGAWFKKMANTAKQGHKVQSKEYAAALAIRNTLQSLDKFLHYSQLGILAAVTAGAIGSAFGIGGKILSLFGAGAGGAGAAGGTGILGRLFGRGAPKALVNTGVRGAGRSAAKIPASIIAKETAKATAKETAKQAAKRGIVRGAASLAGRGVSWGARAAMGPAGWALLAAEVANQVGGRIIKAKLRSEATDLLGEDDNTILDLLQLEALTKKGGGIRDDFSDITRKRNTIAQRKETDIIKSTIKSREDQLTSLKATLRTKERLTHREDKVMRARIGYMEWALKFDKERVERDKKYDRQNQAAQEEATTKEALGYMGRMKERAKQLKASGHTEKEAAQIMAKEMMKAAPGLVKQKGGKDILSTLMRGGVTTGDMTQGATASVYHAQLKGALGEKGMETLRGAMMKEQQSGEMMGYRHRFLRSKMSKEELAKLRTPEQVAQAWMRMFPRDKFGFMHKGLQGIGDISEDMKKRATKARELRVVGENLTAGDDEGSDMPQEVDIDEGMGTMSFFVETARRKVTLYTRRLGAQLKRQNATEQDQHQ